MSNNFRVGCAGWTIPKICADAFAREGSHLQRYASRLDAVEINSTFYRSHLRATYLRWADSVPANFRFSVKMPRAITHEARLAGVGKALDRFFLEISALDRKLGCVLVQLPPSLRFDRALVRRFVKSVRNRFDARCVIEPRHASWFDAPAHELLTEFSVARAAADPAVCLPASMPGGGGELAYFRLHGSPQKYYSSYSDDFLRDLAGQLLSQTARDVWCIFDNTALGHATENALSLESLLLNLLRSRGDRA